MNYDKMTAREFAKKLAKMPWDKAMSEIIEVANQKEIDNHGKIQQ